jgi:hypothetical protein
MCKKCESYNGYTEVITFKCGECHKPVETTWAIDGGVLHGDYELLGDVFFHASCANTFLEEIGKAQ